MKVSIVIPVYNEERTVSQVIARVLAAPLGDGLNEREVIVIDDGSSDATAAALEPIAASGAIELIRHERNRGKGAALRTGFGAATGDMVLVQDGDLEYDPSDYASLLAPIVRGEADVVYGTRFAGKNAAARGFSTGFLHGLGNRLLTALSNLVTGLRLTDMETGYKAFRRGVLERITICEERFGVEPELTAKVARLGARVVEVPITYSRRGYAEGKKIGPRDAVRAVWCIVRYRWGG